MSGRMQKIIETYSENLKKSLQQDKVNNVIGTAWDMQVVNHGAKEEKEVLDSAWDY